MNEPKTPECPNTYRSPQLVDGGTVEERTQHDTDGNSPEYLSVNIIWGQYTELRSDEEA